jgi:DNA-binding transcriptional ArsR family regulator
MVKYSSINLDVIFHSLSDPTRRRILERLSKKPLTVSEIAAPYKMSLVAVSKHLKVLERAKLVRRQKLGREYMIRLHPQPLKFAFKYLRIYKDQWERHLDALEKFLERNN